MFTSFEAGRLDALDSAAAIAARYRSEERVRSLCATVVPVAGLIAETARTFREDEMATLQTLVDMPEVELDLMLLSVDRFSDPSTSPLPSRTRRDLLSLAHPHLGHHARYGCIERDLHLHGLEETDGLADGHAISGLYADGDDHGRGAGAHVAGGLRSKAMGVPLDLDPQPHVVHVVEEA